MHGVKIVRIEKKVWSEWFQKIVDGVKTYDLRLADFEIKPGDILVLREWDPKKKAYTGRVLEKGVTYVGKTKGIPTYTQEDIDRFGFQVIAFK